MAILIQICCEHKDVVCRRIRRSSVLGVNGDQLIGGNLKGAVSVTEDTCGASIACQQQIKLSIVVQVRSIDGCRVLKKRYL